MDKETRLVNAIEAFKSVKFKSIRSAATAHDVDRNTLSWQLNGAQSVQQALAPRQALSPGEEEALISWIQRQQERGFPIRHDMLKAIAEYILAMRNNTHRRDTLSTRVLSHNWAYCFIHRHPYLKSMILRPIEQKRNNACTRESFEKWFNCFRNTTTSYKIDSHNIYNVDETGFQMGNTARTYIIIDKRLGQKGLSGKGSKTENLTVIECGCIDGTVLLPLIIFKGKNLQSSWYSEDAPEDWIAVTSEKGWTSNLLGMTWLRRIFEPQTQAKANGKHRMLIVDGHGSYLTPEFQDYCEKHKIIILCMPAHTSHILQPMDRVFPSVKHWF